MKSFKYFDLNNNGIVEPEEFAKAIEKIGIMIPTKQVNNFLLQTALDPNVDLVLLYLCGEINNNFRILMPSFQSMTPRKMDTSTTKSLLQLSSADP